MALHQHYSQLATLVMDKLCCPVDCPVAYGQESIAVQAGAGS